MVDTLHVIAVAAFLFWCLLSALCQLFASEHDEAPLVWHGRGRDELNREHTLG
jgi:hypothetical protein